MRLFIAINFPREIKTIIAKVRDNLKNDALRGNFTFDENLHLTLVFLGECDARQADAVKTVMESAVFPEFTLVLDKVGYFRRNGGDTWWIGFKENRSLADLQASLSARLIQNGFILENRRYVPHVTIGREVKMREVYVQPEVPHTGFNVTRVDLMKSERINSKLTYTPIYSGERMSR